MKQSNNILLLLIMCLFISCSAKTPSSRAHIEENIDKKYQLRIDDADSVVIKLCRYDNTQEHDSLMARYLFDYFYELIWEETGVTETAYYRLDEKDSILNIIANATTQGLVPSMFRGEEYQSYLETETPVDDQNVIAKIEIFNQEHQLINVLWCSSNYIDGMEEFNFPLRKIMPKGIIKEFENIHKSAKNKSAISISDIISAVATHEGEHGTNKMANSGFVSMEEAEAKALDSEKIAIDELKKKK